MLKTVSKSKFKPQALAYLREVEETRVPLIITDRGVPVLKIEPYAPVEDTLARLRGFILRYDDPLEPVGLEDWDLLP